MRFPVTIRHRASKAKIYGPGGKFAYYRVAFTTAGKRKMQTFAAYSDAKTAAERIVRELANGSQAAALSASQSRDALAAFERLDGYFRAKGKRISLNTAVADYLDAIGKLPVPLPEAVAGYLTTVAAIKRVTVAAAVKEFVDGREAETKSVNGKRPELSKNYFLITKLWLGWFEKAFPGTAVCELTKEHLDLFMAGRNHLAAKSKNHLRATVKMFLNWCIKRDFLPANHRLLDASGMKRQKADSGDTDFYRPDELRAMLDAANDTMRPIIALQGLAGIRLQEAQRLTWQNVFGTAGHIAISATKSKTRSSRLVEVCPALAAWLEPYRQHEGQLWTQSRDTYHAAFVELREVGKIPARKNGLRHAFCTFHFALHGNENLTAAQAGNSPTVIHSAYKGLATKAEAEKWFGIVPANKATNPKTVTRLSKSESARLDAMLSATEPESTAFRALEALFLKAKGQDWHALFSAKPNNYSTDIESVKGGQVTTIEAYARLIREHVENLNSLITTHRELLLPYSKTCFNWPILKSEHPAFSDDEKKILEALKVGKQSGRYFDRSSKWKPEGTQIGWLVDELLEWAETCKHGPSTKRIFLFGRDQNPLATLYRCDENDCPLPIIARLRKYLVPHEKAAARLKALETVLKFKNGLVLLRFDRASSQKKRKKLK